MNLLYFRYALEIAESGSLSRAAERLYIGQPNLSRALRELEASLGAELFERTPRGMAPTPDGEVFLQYAKKILAEVDSVEEMFRNGTVRKERFSLSAPGAGYIARTFAIISAGLDSAPALEVIYREADSTETISAVADGTCSLGILRYDAKQDRFYKTRLDTRGINYELVAEFTPMPVFGSDCPLAAKDDTCFDELSSLIEVSCPTLSIPLLPTGKGNTDTVAARSAGRRIFVSDRAACLELLAQNPGTFMWSSPEPEELLRRCGLVQRRCADSGITYKDVMLRRLDHSLTDLEKSFISELCRIRREVFSAQG